MSEGHFDEDAGSLPDSLYNDEVALDREKDQSVQGGVIRTLNGDEIEDEFDQDAINYRILLGKIDQLLDRLKLDA